MRGRHVTDAVLVFTAAVCCSPLLAVQGLLCSFSLVKLLPLYVYGWPAMRLSPCGGAAPSGRCCDPETMADAWPPPSRI